MVSFVCCAFAAGAVVGENRMIFLRRYWYADAIADIAARYGTTEGAIQMRLNRTKAKLLRYLEREGIQV